MSLAKHNKITDFDLVLFAINVLKHMFTAVKEKLMLKSQGSRAQLKLTLISIMVVKKEKKLAFL